jgi:tetratricopeptide (TPR) repeat protein
VAEYEIGLSAANILLVEEKPDSAIALLGSLTLPPSPALYGPRLGIFNLSVHSPHRRDILSRAYLAKKDTARAIQALEEEVRTYPERPDFRFVNPLLHHSLALLLDGHGETDRAVAEYRKFVAVYGKADGDPPELGHARRRLKDLAGE